MFKRRGIAFLEYSILAALIIATLLIMSSFIKRRYQGSLKASANRIGEQFSTSSETMKIEQKLASEGQSVRTEVLTRPDSGVYTFNVNKGGQITSTVETKSAGFSDENVRGVDYPADDLSGKISDPDLP